MVANQEDIMNERESGDFNMHSNACFEEDKEAKRYKKKEKKNWRGK